MTNILRDPEWADMLKCCVENALYTTSDSSPEVTQAEKSSERMRFHSRFWTMALERAHEQGLSPGSREAWDMVEEASNVGGDIAYQYIDFPSLDLGKSDDPDTVRKANRMRTKLYGDPVRILKKPQHYPPLLEELEAAAEKYFNSQWRSPEIDRLVLRLLLERGERV